MSKVKRVNAAWERIEKWFAEKNPEFKLPAGATAADLTSVETHIGIKLPEELRASLMRHNGTESWTQCELLSTGRLKSEWDCWAGLVDDGTFDDQTGEENDSIQKCWFDKSWIPLDADGGGNGNMIDLNPGPKGKVGQVIYMDHEVGPSGPVFSDLATYLEKAAEELEAGKYTADDEGMLEEGEDEDEDEEDMEENEEDEEEDDGEDEDSDEENHEAVLSKKSKKLKK